MGFSNIANLKQLVTTIIKTWWNQLPVVLVTSEQFEGSISQCIMS